MIWIALPTAHFKVPIKLVQYVRRQWHLPDDAPLAALQRFDIRNAALDVDRCRREGEHFGNPSAAPAQYEAEKPHVGRRAVRRLKETPLRSVILARVGAILYAASEFKHTGPNLTLFNRALSREAVAYFRSSIR